MSNLLSKTQMTVTTDVTGWTSAQRERLLDLIASVEAQLAAEVTPKKPPAKDEAAGAEEVTSTGWTLEIYTDVVKKLARTHGVQASAIMTAADGGGLVTREKVYELGSYPPSRSLKGFTRPVNRIMQKLIEDGTLPDDVDDLFEPVYDPEVTGFQRVKGFRVPQEIVKIVQDRQAELSPAGQE